MITVSKQITPLPAQNMVQLKLDCTVAPAGWSNSIFVFHANAGPTAADGSHNDLFSAVCSLSQIDELGLAAQVERPFYRQPSVTLLLRSEQEAMDVWTAIADDVQDLVDNARAQLAAGGSITSHVFQ